MDPDQIRSLAVALVKGLGEDTFFPAYNETTKRLVIQALISEWLHERMES